VKKVERKVLAILSIAVFFSVAVLTTTGGVSAANAYSKSVGAVYTIDNAAAGNHVLYYSRAADGSITYASSYATNGAGTGTAFHSQGAVVLTEDGKFLLVVDAGSNEISVFSVQSSGLTYLGKASSHGTMPISLAVYKHWVYVLDAGAPANIAGFTLSNAGVLTYIAGSNQPLSTSSPSPEQIGFSPNGKVLVVTEKGTNMIDTYLVDKHGVASDPITQASAGVAPYGFAFTDKGKLVISEASGSSSSYAVSDEGILRTISGAISTYTGTPCWVAINDKGRFAYTGNGGVGTISSFSISHSGELTLTSSIAATVPSPALDLAFSKHSQFLYVLSANGGMSITGFKVDEDGGLSQVTSISSGNLVAAAGLAAS
jgi:6-phosphogluconolactonase (cycloisomerase 2 family)